MNALTNTGAEDYSEIIDQNGFDVLHYASPIIEQDVARVDHSKTVEDLTTLGRDTESQVLARAVKWHSEHRVLINGHKTVIFK